MLLISKLQQYAKNDGLDPRRVGVVGLVAGYAYIFLKICVMMLATGAAAVSLTVLTGSGVLGLILIVSVAFFSVLRLAETKNLSAVQKQAQSVARLFIKTVRCTNQIVESFEGHRDSYQTRVVPVPITPPRA